jgi:hypothetical protein
LANWYFGTPFVTFNAIEVEPSAIKKELACMSGPETLRTRKSPRHCNNSNWLKSLRNKGSIKGRPAVEPFGLEKLQEFYYCCL